MAESAASVVAASTSTPSSPQFWCHVCAASVSTVIDVDSSEVCCRECGGNFVEEIDPEDPPQGFMAREDEEAPTASSSSTSAEQASTTTASANTQTGNPDLDGLGGSTIFSSFADDAAGGLDAAFRARRSRFRRYDPSRGVREEVMMPPPDLLHFLSGGGGRAGGRPVEVFVGGGDGRNADGLLSALDGIFGLATPMLASNPGDYAFGSMASVINQLMQNDPNRHGAPPAAKETVEHLPKLKITQSEVDENAECPVCKDAFAVDEDAHKLPCAHLFHPDCILPWLKQHNSCPVCRFELPTDDPDYERRRQRSASSQSS